MIYFILAGDLVKIGHSNDPRRRLQMLSTGCPFECHMAGVMPGGRDEEAEIHDRFAHLRTKGEWFKFTVEINNFLRKNATQLPSEKRATIDHPLAEFIAKSGNTLSSFCRRIGISRVQLYRIMNGENTTTARIRMISAATGGAVSVSDFFGKRPTTKAKVRQSA